MSKEVKIIGSTIGVRIVGHLDSDVPAKIDTGADDSSIWASSINEADGYLSFELFAPSSNFYNGKKITLKNYYLTKIKNSFGESELRYKVEIPIKIDGKLYKASFNLADRSKSRFPILIGKKFLTDRFIVDVSKNEPARDLELNRPIIVLKSTIGKKSKGFIEKLEKSMKSELILEKYTSLKFEINDDSIPAISLPNGTDIASAKMVYFKSHNLFPEHTSAVSQYLGYKHVPFFDKEVGFFVSFSKLSEIFVLATNGIAIPKSLIVSGKKHIPSYSSLKKDFGEKFVIKEASSDRGKNNFLVAGDTSYQEAISRLDDLGIFIVQKYIENDGFVRVLIMGGDVVQVVQRSTSVHSDPLKSHLNKPFGGANAVELKKNEFDPKVIILARKASIAMKRNVAGVDVIQDKLTQKWYVLEVNNNPEVIGGLDPSKKIKRLARLLESNNR